MLRDYSAELLAGGYQDCFTWPYTYAVFDDGHPIDREMRRLFRELPPGRFPDPFRSAGAGTFREWAISAGAPAPVVSPALPRWDPPAKEASLRPAADPVGTARAADGATVVGYLRAESGMGELARSTVRALRAMSYPLTVRELRAAAHRHADLSVDALDTGETLAFTIVALTAPDARRERDRIGPPSRSSFRIGYWPWELEAFPDDLGDVFSGFDEIWALSRFSAGAIARASPVPVHAIWPALPDVGPSAAPARDTALEPDEYNFLFVYDVLSETDRKNPLDLIRAFRQAFRRDDRVRLTLKTSNGHMRSHEWRRVVRAADGLPITVCDRYLSRPDLLALMRSCDCYVSLHRSEGFGFTLVEAMALGKPVIATFYSANAEYMTPWNSFPVPYRMGEVRARRGAYRKGDAWAEPDVEAAAALMRQAYCDRERAQDVGRRGRRDVTSQLSVSACGSRMRRRFEASRR
jgi:glycosyltransferase involved in cell wall biosynthesis